MTSPQLLLITGANAGLGYHTVKQLLPQGAFHMLVGARSLSKSQSAIKQILSDDPKADGSLLEPIEIDLNSDDSIQAAVQYVEKTHGKLDILVNNAGISKVPGQTAREQWTAILGTNVVGTALVTNAFIPLLKKSTAPNKRIVNVSSGLGSMALTQKAVVPIVEKYTPYSVSKAAENMLTLYTATLLKDEGITVLTLSPGFCATNLNDHTGTNPPEYGGAAIAHAVTVENKGELHGAFLGDSPGVEFPY